MLTLAFVLLTLAQESRRMAWAPLGSDAEPLGRAARDLARARFAADQATPAELGRQLRATAEEAYQARFNEFLAGRGQVDLLLAASEAVVEAARRGGAGPAALLARLAWHGDQTRLEEGIARTRYHTGQITIQDWMAIRANRFRVERAWREFAQAHPELAAPGFAGGAPDPRAERDRAKALWAAGQATAEQWTREELAAVGQVAHARFQEFLAGRGAVDLLLNSALGVLPLARRLGEDSPAVRAGLWEVLAMADHLARVRHANGRIMTQEAAEVWQQPYQAVLTFREAPAGGRPPASGFPLIHVWLRDTLPGLAELTIEAERGAARRRFDVWTAPTAGLRRTIFDLAQVEWQARYEEFLAGRGATDVLLAAGHRRRDAALALAETAAARRALLEDHWRWCWSAEAIALARHHSGRVTIQELLAVRFERLLAELDLKTAGN